MHGGNRLIQERGGGNPVLPCFFGKMYLRGGRIRMYPAAVFRKKDLNESDKETV